ncbi:MAG: hypothetical protein RI909_332 [Bacteroidota bacterium]
MTKLATLAGIDFGAKLAGTTAMTTLRDSKFQIRDCQKGDDADAWIVEQVATQKIDIVFLDAPLSLPPAYFNDHSTEFFYRKADAALGAMSPMFLGGLTARAMKLKRLLTAKNVIVFETYPAALVREWFPETKSYKKDLRGFRKELLVTTKKLDLPTPPSFKTFHQVDSLLAWISGYRHLTQQSLIYGSEEEGAIFI